MLLRAFLAHISRVWLILWSKCSREGALSSLFFHLTLGANCAKSFVTRGGGGEEPGKGRCAKKPATLAQHGQNNEHGDKK
jgi:hypothetical protein